MTKKHNKNIFVILLIILSNCNNINNLKEKELELKEKELILREKELELKKTESNNKLTTFDAKKNAEIQFNKYLPNILKTHDNAELDLQESYLGDFTGDGIEDVVIYFSLSPNGGGNAMVGQGLTLYQNNGNSVKVIAGFEPNYLFRFYKIRNGNIYIKKLEYAENDARCCPSIESEHILTISNNQVF